MHFLNDDKPIIACSTGRKENTAIAVIRISGFYCLDDLQKFFSRSLSFFKPRNVHFTQLVHPVSQELLDEVLLTYFQAPHSYNGEHILEISCHGNQLNIQRIIDVFVEYGDIRVAQNGEFTYRALRNKKLQLSQVEGLDLFLNSQTQFGLSQGMQLLNGQLHEQYQNLYQGLLHLKASVELLIDFSEDVGEEQAQIQLQTSFRYVEQLITSLSHRLNQRPESLTSPEIVLGGRTNAGKSTLFNLLLNEKRAITSSTAGTTRDFLSESLLIDGDNFRLIDTAGIRETTDSIEEEGVSRSLQSLKNAFFRIYVADASHISVNSILSDLKLFDFDLLVFTHGDRVSDLENFKRKLDQKLSQYNILLCDLSGSTGANLKSVSQKANQDIGPMGADSSRASIAPSWDTGSMGADTGRGPIEPGHQNSNNISKMCWSHEDLMTNIHQLVSCKFNDLLDEDPLILTRHRQVIKKLFVELTHLQRVMDDEPAIISAHINNMCLLSGELIGFIDVEDVLDSVFSKFCIGK